MLGIAVMPLSTFTIYAESIRHRLHLRLAEWNLAVAMTLAGLVLMQEPRTFDLATYALIEQIGSEESWAWVMFLIGSARLVVLTINGALKRGSPHLRSIFAGMSVLVWSILLAGYLSSNVPSLMIAMTGAALFTELVNVFRTSASAAVEDRANGRAT